MNEINDSNYLKKLFTNESATILRSQGKTHWVKKQIVEETRYFEATSADGGYVNDLEFAKLLQENFETATYIAYGTECVYKSHTDTACKVYKDANDTDWWEVILYTDNSGNLTGRILFGDNGIGEFINGSITIKTEKEVYVPIPKPFIPYTTFYGKFPAGSGDNAIYVDADRTIKATSADVFEAHKHSNIVFEVDGVEIIPSIEGAIGMGASFTFDGTTWNTTG
jgi:hypothetical protein